MANDNFFRCPECKKFIKKKDFLIEHSICRSCFNQAEIKETEKKIECDLSAKNYKTCATCGRALPTSFFYKMRSSRDGLRNACKSCCRDAWGAGSYVKGKTNIKFSNNIQSVIEKNETRKIVYGNSLIGYCVYISRYRILAVSVHGGTKILATIKDCKIYLANETRKALENTKRHLKST